MPFIISLMIRSVCATMDAEYKTCRRPKHDLHNRVAGDRDRGGAVTYTVLGRAPTSGLLGAATASRSLAVGSSVIALSPGIGAAASQAWTNPDLRGLLLDALRAGSAPRDAVARVPEWDAEPELRQVAAISLGASAGAARSGRDITAAAGDRVLPDAVVVGNLLADAGVLDAMARAWEESDSDAGESAAAAFAERLIGVLAAGESAGGDARGRQSAAILVADRERVLIDLRVDDHPEPVTELRRLVDLRTR